MQLKNGDRYINTRSKKTFELVENDGERWHLHGVDDKFNLETGKMSGETMKRLLQTSYSREE